MPTILSVAYPFARVGPAAVGGAEVILSALEAALVAEDYGSVVLAAEGSAPAGELVPIPQPTGLLDDEAIQRTTAATQRLLDALFRENQRRIDLVHFHGLDFHRYRVPAGMPVLVTLHLPPSWYPESIWQLPAQYTLACVSESQLRSCPPEVRFRLRVLPNGVPLTPAHPRPGRHGFTLMLSRICPEKNLAAGLDAAQRAGVPCLLAGETFPYEAHQRYLREEIEPRLRSARPDRPGARLAGPLTGERKRRFLQAARCVLLPTLAPETSSLVAMEALAAGTPVVAFRSGALPEIVEHGRTGFLVDTTEEMATAILRVGEIDPAVCRAAAEHCFSFRSMAERYLALYRELLQNPG